jgi:Lantibiotic dehydratase, N terminus
MDHDGERLPLGDEWLLWRHFVLRGAGFPFANLTAALVPEAASVPAAAGEQDWLCACSATIGRALELANDDRLRMALLWQNPPILDVSIGWLNRHADRAHYRIQPRRRHERVVVKYLQRYHAKNDSVGFFGPAVWGSFGQIGSRAVVEPGAAVAGRQNTHFEDWAMYAVGQAFAADPWLAGQLPPALAFGVTRIGTALVRPDGSMRRIAAGQAGIVGLIDGFHTARDIAGTLHIGVDEVEAVVSALIGEGLVTRTFDVPAEPAAEEALAGALSQLPPSPQLARAQAALAELGAAREAVERANSSGSLSAALVKLDDRFSAISETAATRRRDESPRGRRLLVMQCERDLQITLGQKLVDDLAAPLSLVLASARWLCQRAGEEFDGLARMAYQRVAPLFAEDSVPLTALCGHLLPAIQQGRWLDEIVSDLGHRWAGVLEADLDAPRVVRHAADIAAAVARCFDAPAPGWHAGRHHSPDVMIAADSVAAINAGDYEFVLGEMHIGMVTADHCAFNELAPDPDLVRRCVDLALLDEQPRFVPLHARGPGSPITGFDYPPPEAFSPAYTYLSFGERIGERAAPGPRVPASAVAVATTGAGLTARFPDGAHHPLLQVLGEYVTYALASRFRMLPARPHTPRIVIDRLVVTRETWRVPRADLEPLTRRPEHEAYAGLRRLAAERGIPRHTFWRPARETKPIYLDLHSPALALLLLHEARPATSGAAEFTVTEMHPGPGQLWLPDAEGNRYTSELRLTVADTRRPAAATGRRS